MNSPLSPKRIAQIEVSLLALAIALFLWWSHQGGRAEAPRVPLVAVSTTTRQLPTFPLTPIEARSAIVYDAVTGKTLFEKDADAVRPLASLTKLMSALTVSILAPDYLLVRVTADDIREEGDTGLLIGEQWNIGNLVDFSLITSSNDGIRAVAATGGSIISSTSTDPQALFVEKMNSLAREIGLRTAYFYNQSGLDVSQTVSGGYGSAREVALLVDFILKHKPHLLEATSYGQISLTSKNAVHAASNTNKAIGEIPNVLASKTGYTDLSGGNVVVAFNAGLDHPLIIAVLGSSYEGRFADLEALARSTLAYLAQNSGSVKPY
ncbi:MAG TPA: hypothetical protein VFQ72_00190 [Candidatus Paceibacterota bacterium]|nr:hypothetical protein [Candidatus Paceibacterota bacterium]